MEGTGISDEPKSPSPAAYAAGALLACFLLAAAIFFSQADQDVLRQQVHNFLSIARGSPWALLLVCAFYIVGGAVLFPVMVTNFACAVVFGLWGIVYGLIGAMLSAAFFFALGRLARRRGLDTVLERQPRIKAIDQKLADSGVIGITLLRFVPLAPYSMFNIAAGISSVLFATYMAGTFLSLAPGAVARGLLGDSLTRLFLDPTPENYAYVTLGLVFWAAVVAGVHFILKKSRASAAAQKP